VKRVTGGVAAVLVVAGVVYVIGSGHFRQRAVAVGGAGTTAVSSTTLASTPGGPAADDVLHVAIHWTQPGHTNLEDLWTYPAQASAGTTVQARGRTAQNGQTYQDDSVQFTEPACSAGPVTGIGANGTGIMVDYITKTWSALKAQGMIDTLSPNSVGSEAFDPALNSGQTCAKR
jgi:hypothetical protein